MTDNRHVVNDQETPQIFAYSYNLLRHELLPELLGEDEEMILYWAGKSLARKKMNEVETIEITKFFHLANWGSLQIAKEKRHERVYELVAPHMTKERPFSLEAGFLAQVIESEKGVVSEASYEIKRKKPLTMLITIRWDKNDPISKD